MRTARVTKQARPASAKGYGGPPKPYAKAEGLGYEVGMTLDHVVGLIVTVGLLVYLTYALLRPEKF